MKTHTFRVKEKFHDQKENIIRKPQSTFTTNDDERANELKKLPYVKHISSIEVKEAKPKKKYTKKSKDNDKQS